MDFSSFGEDQWEVKTWANAAFSEIKREKRDAHAASLLTKLQLVAQDIVKSIEEASDQGAQAVPRAARELEAARQEASFLRRHMENVKLGLEDVEAKTNNSIKVLLSIDKVKERVEDSASALKKVDNWSQLTQEAEQSFLDQDMNSISEKLAQLDQSILIFQGAPDFSEKVKLLDQLKNRLEATLSSKVISAIQTYNTQVTKECAVHFQKIGRESQFKSYFIKTIRQQIKLLWESKDDRERINALYDTLLDRYQNEIGFINAVFGAESGPSTILQLYTETLKSLPVKETLKSMLDESDPDGTLVVLANLRLSGGNFVDSIRNHLDATGHALKTREIEMFVQAVWAPYGQSIVLFRDLIALSSTARVSSYRIDGDLMGLAQHLNNVTEHLREMHSEALQLCRDVTSSMGLLMLKEGLTKAHLKLVQRTAAALSDAKSVHLSAVGESSVGEDWSLFASGLTFLEHFGPWLLELDRFEAELAAELATLEQFSSASMMDSAIKGDCDARWNFNILQFCAPGKFGELQGLIDLGMQPDALLIPESKEAFASLCQTATELAFDAAFVTIKSSIDALCEMDFWTKEDPPLPSCGYSPTEMITHVGDALLTLPQHLDPISNENASLKRSAGVTHLPYLAHENELDDDDEFDRRHGPSAWLCAAGNGACTIFMERILEISALSDWGRFQLICDLQYLESVSDSLGVEITAEWRSLLQLLECKSEDLAQIAAKSPRRIADEIYRMRNVH